MKSRIGNIVLFVPALVLLTLVRSLAGATAGDQNASFVLEMRGAKAGVVVSIDELTEGAGTSAPGSIVLKRVRASGAFSRWTRSGRRALPETLTVFLKKPNGEVLGGWRIRSAKPVKWEGPTLAGKGGDDVVIETIELAHEGIEPIY